MHAWTLALLSYSKQNGLLTSNRLGGKHQRKLCKYIALPHPLTRPLNFQGLDYRLPVGHSLSDHFCREVVNLGRNQLRHKMADEINC